MSRSRKSARPLTVAVLLISGVLAAVHIFATLVFTGPSTPIKTSLEPQLSNYFLGPLDQGWSLFAPGPYSQDEYLLVQACLSTADVCAKGSKGGAKFSEWRNVTEEEMLHLSGNIFANRGSKQSKVIHGRLWPTINDLSDEHANEIAKPFVLGNPVFGYDLDSKEAAESIPASELQDMRSYKRMEDVAVGFATLYAKEQWGSASMVQLKLRRDAVTPFAQRHKPEKERSSSERLIGWRDVKAFGEDTVASWS
ncbi:MULTISPECIES: DUF5819 family protein [Glutamicibacter]|uniref:DUF5819 family protein n=1 Tax=Glutamicibacter sp. PS TaxID=3075634 RepID=UPI0028422EA1|nr:DUF5819 family protein [Glutamicibacter sp. PS]MDR4531895.1 DUF5819 family protein [Glutamicibacter sp. PS]